MNVIRHSDSFIFSVHSGMEAACYSETIILTFILTMETTDWYPPIIKCIFITQKNQYKSGVYSQLKNNTYSTI
jgi:hypothetical protein